MDITQDSRVLPLGVIKLNKRIDLIKQQVKLNKMKTPYLDTHLEGLKKLKKNNKISKHGSGLLLELIELKQQLLIHSVVKCFYCQTERCDKQCDECGLLELNKLI
jgi:hypothetical protein